MVFGEVFDICLRVVVVADQRRDRKKHHRKRRKVKADLAVVLAHRGLHQWKCGEQFAAGTRLLCDIGLREKHYHAGSHADRHIYKNRHRLHESLLYRMARVSSGCRVWRRTHASFV